MIFVIIVIIAQFSGSSVVAPTSGIKKDFKKKTVR